MRLLPSVICSLALIGCGQSTKQIMDSWKGHHVPSLIRSWGPPQQVVSDEAGGQICIWRNRIHVPIAEGKKKTSGTITHYPYSSKFKSESTYTPPLVLKGDKVRMFWVDSQGIIYHWRAQGFVNNPDEDAVWIGVGVGVIVIYVVLRIMMAPNYDYPDLDGGTRDY